MPPCLRWTATASLLPRDRGLSSRTGGRLSPLLANRCTRSARVLQHLRGMSARGLGDPEAAQHARDLLDARIAVERLHARQRAARPGRLRHLELLARVNRDLREVRDAEHLVVPPQGLQELAHDLRDAAADARIHLVEDERRHRRLAREEHLDRERDARELAAGGDLRERRERLARVRRDAQLHGLEPPGGRRLERLERDLEPAARHREALQRTRDLHAEALRGALAFPGKLDRELAIGLLARPLLLAQLLEALLAAQLRE